MSAYDYTIYGGDGRYGEDTTYDGLAGAAGKAARLANQAALLEAQTRLATAQQASPAITPATQVGVGSTAPAPAPTGDEPGLLDTVKGAFSGLPSWAIYGGAGLILFMMLKKR